MSRTIVKMVANARAEGFKDAMHGRPPLQPYKTEGMNEQYLLGHEAGVEFLDVHPAPTNGEEASP